MFMQQITIEKNVFGGKGLGRLNGKAVFVPYALAGDVLNISIQAERNDFSEATILEIIKPSPERITPACPNFSVCGGCDYLCTEYDNELEIKKNIIIDTARRNGKIILESNEIKTIHGERFSYRSHATIKSDGKLNGFYSRQSNTIVPFPESGCLLLAEELRNSIKKINIAGETKISLSTDKSVIWGQKDGSAAKVTEEVNGFKYEHGLYSFFQSNRFLRSEMLATVIENATGNYETCLDIGCGCGFFSIPFSRTCASVTGIDVSEESISSAKRNSFLNNAQNVRFIRSTMEKFSSGKHKFDLIVADPPRAGLAKQTRTFITTCSAKKIIYVSCDPASWARDAAHIIASGFKLESFTFIDMFPGTQHIELITSFTPA